MKRILVNLPVLQCKEIFPPWLRIFKVFQSHESEIFLNTGMFVKKMERIEDIYNFRWLSENEKEKLSRGKVNTKMSFLFHALKRNVNVLKNRKVIFRDNNFDLIYTPSAVLDFVLFPYFLKITRTNTKWATTLANIVPFSDPGNGFIRILAWIFFRTSLFMIRKADIVFVPTPEIKSYLVKRNFPENKLVETCFAIENELIEKAKKPENRNIDALYVGRINETKGIYDMLNVLNTVKKKYPDFQLAIMGDGDEKTKNKFRDKIKKMNLAGNIKFMGYRVGQEKYDVIKSAKSFWFLSVSESESFGMALLEAVCSGIPSFSYDLAQFSWLYPDGEVDISPKGDWKIVAEKVINLFERENFINEKGKLLLGKYSWEKIAEIEFDAIKNLYPE
jgi:glycosyltransferase involved in cell wall biosynthesis